ncbi:MAG TPA: TonB-dependent receptor [Saprospiraceae bacterium]|nr:TonB-dependent receptor [Saprospiraceae bacterium]
MIRFLLLFLFIPILVYSQEMLDSSFFIIELEHVEVKSQRVVQEVDYLPVVKGTYIIGGRKNEVVNLSHIPGNLSEKIGRQLFARIPGAFIYDMDGSGNQVNMSVRGLDPHRSWEFNVRQNGVIINSDMYGYPASHYSMPMESIEKVELVRGTGSLQYGQQFGGMLNYITKSPDTSKVIGYEGINTIGSYGLFSTYHALGGKVNKFSYYTYYHKRVSDGYRQHSRSDAEAQFLQISYELYPYFKIRAELGRSTYLYQLPGPLNDAMFNENPRQSSRTRNFYSPDIYVPSLSLDWKIGRNTSLNWVTSGIYGSRNSVLFEGFADREDLIDPATLEYSRRNVHIDNYHSRTSEVRLLHDYQWLGRQNHLNMGMRYFNNNLKRRQRGTGTSGFGYDLSVVDGYFGRDLNFLSESIAAFVENLTYITPDLLLSAGIRYEYGGSNLTGFIDYLPSENFPDELKYRFPTYSVNVKYNLAEGHSIYSGFSTANRPVLFKDMIPPSTLEVPNENLRDGNGYNAELGIKGNFTSVLQYEVTGFYMSYNDRIEGLLIVRDGMPLIAKSNIGSSTTKGIELYMEWIAWVSHSSRLSFFTSTSYMDARYVSGMMVQQGVNVDLAGNRVEAVPHWISRNGAKCQFRNITGLLQFHYVSSSYSDPFNTIDPLSNGSVGFVPSYSLWDFNLIHQLNDRFTIQAGMNNIANRQYFTRRPLFYPGPGIWPSDGRSLVVSVGIKI